MTYYVYELIDPRDDTVFYVGKGTGYRIDHHEAEARRGKQSRKCDRIRAIHDAGRYVRKRKVAFYADEDAAYLAEWILMQSYEDLTNDVRHCQRARAKAKKIADAMWVRAAAELANRSNGGTTTILLGDVPLRLDVILRTYIERSGDAISRRGLEWANKIAAKFDVRFVNVAPL